MPSVFLALKIAQYFGKPLEEIFFIEDENQSTGEIES